MSGEHEESEESPDDIQLRSKLKENGLDPEYWLNEIKTLGITNINALKHFQTEDFSSLENKIRYPWEKRALRKLFDIPDRSVKRAEVQEKQAQALRQRNEQASKILEQLKALRSEKKNLQDEAVLRKVEEMQKLLEIHTESSPPPDTSLGNLIDYFEMLIFLLVDVSAKTNHYTDEEVIKHSSGGLALEGIYHTKNTADYFGKRETLLCVPEDFHLLGPEQSSYFRQKEFTSQEEENCFRKTIEKIGFSLSGSVGVSLKGFGLGFGLDTSKHSTSEISTNSSEDHTYICTARYNYIPLASYYFTKNELRLSQNALSELKDIEKLICMNSDTQIVSGKCEEFFQRFGSHANLGPVHFGGIFWWKATMEDVHKNMICEAKTSINQALNYFMNCSYFRPTGNVANSNPNSQGFAEKSKTSQLEKKIQVSVIKTGGPLEADSMPHWKAGLVTSNRSWSVIDRGFQIISVWKIIVDNHKSEFKDAIKLSSCLMDSYKLLTGRDSEVLDGEQLLVAYDEIQLFLEDVKSWDANNVKKHLNDLLELKEKINTLIKSHSPWVNVCLADKNLQSFLVKVAEKHEAEFSIDTYIIKGLMQEIIEPHIYSPEDFPGASVLVKWIYDSDIDKLDHIDIREFTQLSDVLQKSIDDIRQVTLTLSSSKEEVHKVKVIAKINISLSIYSFLRILRKTEQNEKELLILCIAKNSGYCVENYNFRLLLGHREIEFLKDQLCKAYEEYTNLRNKCAIQAQSFVLYAGLTSRGQYNEISSQQKRERLDFMIKHLGNALSPDIENMLNQNSGNWEVVEENLRAFSNGGGLQEEVQDQDLMIKDLGNALSLDVENILEQNSGDSEVVEENMRAFSNGGGLQEEVQDQDFMIKHLGNALSPDVENILNQNSEDSEVVEENLKAFSNGGGLREEVQDQDFMIKRLENALSPDLENILNQNSGDSEVVEENLRAFNNGGGLQEEIQDQDFVKQPRHLVQEEKPPTETSDVLDVSNTKEDFFVLLKNLDLEKLYPGKMKTADFHRISRATLSRAEPSESKELPNYFLQKLLVLDYGARYVYCENKPKESQSNTSAINSANMIASSEDGRKTFFSKNKKATKKLNIQPDHDIHPMDVQMAIFHCADDFMRQYIYTKLSFCQFALPFLVPDPNTRSIEFPLWAFQEVKKKWKSKCRNPNSESNDKFMKDSDTPIVSFIRLGTSNFSKSQTINWLMSKHRYNIFYHRHCEGSTKHSVLMDGVTEIAWYCPGGRQDDAFNDCTAFVNLHGDARNHDQQLKFIQEISSVLVIILTDDDVNDSKSASILDQLLDSTKPCVFLLVDEELGESDNPHKVKIGMKGRNESKLIKEVITIIKELLLIHKEVYSLNKCADLARSHGFKVDEDKEECRFSQEQAEKLLNLLKTKELSPRKNIFLPLQGDLWMEWCKNNKNLHRLGKSNLSLEQQRSDIESKSKTLRREQLKRASPLNSFMKDFLQFLYSDEQGFKMYFLQWFKMYLDELSSESLSVLYPKYHHLWSSIKTEKQGGKNKKIIDKLENELQELSDQITLSTFGLEHVLRELGQIYEALEPNTKDPIISNLQKITASLMIWGYPIELMDGDAAHVPLKWVTAILHELKNILGDKKLFVLSVLGIQSTGKSTLLNAMFGLQFAVSAGRCTRGAFMQLVKIDEALQKEMTYDYILVVDTEGLRSSEMSSRDLLNHDNELATFVIGLGNLTLINIFGENPSEMQDILQIAVQAFLRMKKVNLHPSCLFIHQNVGEITAQERNMEGRRCLQRKLDEMTVCAAKQEECDATCFNDVITFDVDSHIHYFSHLWEGDPPMAPPNPRYSQNVQALRKVILGSGKGRDNILSISDFSRRVSDLWNALLNENFVFSFKNSLEIAAYRQVEVKFNEWAWRLRERMLTLQNEIKNQIEKGEIKSIDWISMIKLLDEVYDAVQDDRNRFFNESKEKNILVQWRENIEIRMHTLQQELIAEMKKKAKERITLKEKNKEIDGMKAKCEDEIYTKSKEVALSLKGKNVNGKDLEAKFTDLWKQWISAIKKDLPPHESPDIHKDLDEILLEQFNREANVTNTIQESRTWVNLTDEFSKLISSKKKHLHMFGRESLSDDTRTEINHSINVLKKRIDEYIDKKEQEKMDYLSGYFHEILKIIREEINIRFEKEKFKFLSDYIFYASLFLCRNAAHRFQKLSDAYRKANDPVAYLESKRTEFYKYFNVSCEGKLEVASLAEIISNKLQVSFQQAVYGKSIIDVSREMICNYPALNGNRSKVEFYLLKSLAEKEDFQKYLTYFTDPKTAVKDFINECIEDYMSTKTSGFLLTSVGDFKEITLNAINQSTVKIKEQKGNVDSWLDAFCSGLGNKLNLSRRDFKSVKYQDITEIDFLKEVMTQAVDTAVQRLEEELSTCDMVRYRQGILTIMTDFSCCWKQCPFCGAICTNTVPDHSESHSVQYHRPNGLNGWRIKSTQKLITDICTSLVDSDRSFYRSHDEEKTFPYRRFSEAGPPYSEWSITPDNSSLSYWKWVACRFQSDIEKHYDREFETIPEQWKNISKADVISEIDRLIGETKQEKSFLVR